MRSKSRETVRSRGRDEREEKNREVRGEVDGKWKGAVQAGRIPNSSFERLARVAKKKRKKVIDSPW